MIEFEYSKVHLPFRTLDSLPRYSIIRDLGYGWHLNNEVRNNIQMITRDLLQRKASVELCGLNSFTNSILFNFGGAVISTDT